MTEHPDKAFDELLVKPIGHIRTPFKQKFGIPRQPNLVDAAIGEIHFADNINVSDACQGIHEFSHLWLVFEFHQHKDRTASMKVRPPRLGGTESVGVFASRSSFRPNPLGLSVVNNLGVKGNVLVVSGIDMLDGTPILDIKPYIAYADAIVRATCSYAQTAPNATIDVIIADNVLSKLSGLDLTPTLVTQVLSQDPRPAHDRNKTRSKDYRMRLGNADLYWRFTNPCEITVFDITQG